MVSSAPQIRYPDYYGIDMSHLEELCAFRAAIALLQERGMQTVIADTYQACKSDPLSANHVRRRPVTPDNFQCSGISVQSAGSIAISSATMFCT